MPTRNVVLTDSQTDLIERLIADGRYQNASRRSGPGCVCSSARRPR